ncbi:hypothetical protein N431DRAFT_207706 [Stipitochalara longipes BDJ]|nr:hypothetical protein N431DRAFT_207706 [Stipitochalara longipes BDJ]
MAQLTSPTAPSAYVPIYVFLFLGFVTLGNGNAIQITPAPPEPTYKAEFELAKRATDTWGYISGESNSPLTCPQGYTRTYDGEANNFVACCNAVVCNNDWHTCVPYGGTDCADAGICSEIYTSFTSCGQALPGCETYVLPTVSGVGATEGVTSYNCGPTETFIRVLTSVTGVQKSAPASSTAGTQQTSNFLSSPSQTSNPNPSTSNPGTSGGSGSSATSGTSASSSHHFSTGAIVGITIGSIIGLIVFALVLWAVFICLRWCFRQCCGGGPRPHESVYGGTHYEMDNVAQWRDNQGR